MLNSPSQRLCLLSRGREVYRKMSQSLEAARFRLKMLSNGFLLRCNCSSLDLSRRFNLKPNRGCSSFAEWKILYAKPILIIFVIMLTVGGLHSNVWATFISMMASSNGNILRVTGPLCGEITGHQWIPLTKASDADLWCVFFICARINDWGNSRAAGDLRRHRAHNDVTVMEYSDIVFKPVRLTTYTNATLWVLFICGLLCQEQVSGDVVTCPCPRYLGPVSIYRQYFLGMGSPC